MRRFFFPLLLAGFLFFPVNLPAQTGIEWTLPGDRIDEAEGRGLVVRSNPPNARVFVDGIERGRTPLHLDNLWPGRYFVRLERDGYVDRRFSVVVRAGSVVDVSLEMRRAVGRVLLRIQGAPDSPPPSVLPLVPRITVDGQVNLLRALELPIGFRTIGVQAFGWEDFSHTMHIEADSLQELEVNMRPAAFALSGGSLSRPHFNPANAGSLGTTTLTFQASAPGYGELTVQSVDGEIVLTRRLEPFETWSQAAVWNGRNSSGEALPDGLYTMTINAASKPLDDSAPVEQNISLQVWLDSSRIIYPLTLSSGKSGLLFAPFPSVLPPGSFQIEGSLLVGNPPDVSPHAGGYWSSLPFAAAFRFSPVERLEVIAALNAIPRFQGNAGVGVSGGVKWAFYEAGAGNSPFGAAAGANFSWAGATGLTPFGMASGAEFFFPVSVNFARRFSFALTPAALWTADEGFPWEATPRLLVSGGLKMRMTYLSAGLSVRTEYDFSSDALTPFVIAGGQILLFPPPSSFVLSLFGGVQVRGSRLGGFGGIGIGMIN